MRQIKYWKKKIDPKWIIWIKMSRYIPLVQDPNKPGYLRNDNNDFLNYTDDWYILGFKPDVYAVIYYRGNNDAWQGYGGLTVYTR